MTVMQISLNSICSWVIFITKPQVYYKADCNIYIILNSWTCLGWFSLPLDWKLNFIVTLKWQNLVFIWVKKITSESYTILKYFLCILSFLTSCKLENLGVHMVCNCIFCFPFSCASSWACVWYFKSYLPTPREFRPRWTLAFPVRSWWICGFIQ